ncbi:hypothetical protein [Streptomyces sp. NPDC015350]|uniref:hypothetical protein n=1 Tax=Streptomyces sp. NPDC015350 TaxID=3364955 RepID=UPI0036FD24F9
MYFRDRAIHDLIEDVVSEHDPTLTTVHQLLEFLGASYVFSGLGVQDVWISSDGDGHRLEINIRGWGVYQSAILFPDPASPWLVTRPGGEAMNVRTAAEHIYTIVANVVEGVARDAERYVYDAIATYVVVVERPNLTQTLAGSPGSRDALVTALGALCMAAAELGLDYSPREAHDQLSEHGKYTLGQLCVTIQLQVNADPAPCLKLRPVVPAPDRFLSRDL